MEEGEPQLPELGPEGRGGEAEEEEGEEGEGGEGGVTTAESSCAGGWVEVGHGGMVGGSGLFSRVEQGLYLAPQLKDGHFINGGPREKERERAVPRVHDAAFHKLLPACLQLHMLLLPPVTVHSSPLPPPASILLSVPLSPPPSPPRAPPSMQAQLLPSLPRRPRTLSWPSSAAVALLGIRGWTTSGGQQYRR